MGKTFGRILNWLRTSFSPQKRQKSGLETYEANETTPKVIEAMEQMISGLMDKMHGADAEETAPQTAQGTGQGARNIRIHVRDDDGVERLLGEFTQWEDVAARELQFSISSDQAAEEMPAELYGVNLKAPQTVECSGTVVTTPQMLEDLFAMLGIPCVGASYACYDTKWDLPPDSESMAERPDYTCHPLLAVTHKKITTHKVDYG